MTMKYILPDKVYDAIKYFVTIVMPAISILYVGLAAIWGWPYADEVSRTFAVVYSFLCAVMGFSTLTAKPDEDPTEELA